MTLTQEGADAPPVPEGYVRLTIDDRDRRRPQGRADHPHVRAARDHRAALLRPPAARPGGRVPPVPGRGRDGRAADAQAAGQLHDDGGRRHGRAHPAHVEGGRQGAAGRHGAAADQPPARLPDLRQGRRVPAAEPGDELGAHRVAVRRHQAHVRQAHPDLHRGAARPRALRALPALHPVLRADRGRPVHRAARTRRPAADRRGRGQAVPELLLRQHDPDLPGRRAHERGLPVPVAARSTWCPRPRVCEHCACGSAMRTDTRRGVVLRRMAGNDPAVNEEWIDDKSRFAFRYITSARPDHPADGPPARRHAGRDVVDRGAVGRRARACWPRARAASACSRAGGSPSRTPTPTRKFARVAAGTNDVDFRARPHSAEELEFLAAHVVGQGPEILDYTRLEAASTVLCVALEPEEEAPIVYLRLRKRGAQARPERLPPRAVDHARRGAHLAVHRCGGAPGQGQPHPGRARRGGRGARRPAGGRAHRAGPGRGDPGR